MNFTSLVEALSAWAVPSFLLIALVFAWFKGSKVFDDFVEGAAEGFSTAVKLMPFLVGMMVAIGLFRDSGAMKYLGIVLQPVLIKFSVPHELLPLALMRPVSGSSALAITAEIMQSTGPDSMLGRMASTMMGSTDTTLFVLTVYFGAVGIKKTRYALAVGLIADLAGILASVYVCNLFFN
ncbi:MAG: spore maturation protein [Firmicutes bacterium]|nr:spore maturation protein [Bacillota bacterium]